MRFLNVFGLFVFYDLIVCRADHFLKAIMVDRSMLIYVCTLLRAPVNSLGKSSCQ